MDLSHKNVIFLGDSVTEGGAADSPDKIYHAVLKKLLRLGTVRNEGLGGTRIAAQTMPSSELSYDEDFNKRYDVMDKNADILFIFGGTNDFGHGDAEIGTESDDSVYTFYGALNALLAKAVKDFGKENVFVLTPMHRLGEDNLRGEGNKGKDCLPLSGYVQIIKKQAEKFGVRLIDLYKDERLNINVGDNKKYFADGLHPNNDGHKLLAEIIKENIEKF